VHEEANKKVSDYGITAIHVTADKKHILSQTFNNNVAVLKSSTLELVKEFPLHSDWLISSLLMNNNLLLLGNGSDNLIGVDPSNDYQEKFKIDLGTIAFSMTKLSESEVLLGMWNSTI